MQGPNQLRRSNDALRGSGGKLPWNLGLSSLPILTAEENPSEEERSSAWDSSENMEETSSSPSSPFSEDKAVEDMNVKFENLLDLPDPFYVSGAVHGSMPLMKQKLQNISKSKNITGAYHGTIKPLKFKYPAQLKENWNDIPVFVPREYRHCTNSSTLQCSCHTIVDPPIPSDALTFAIEFVDVPLPYGRCQHKTSPCNLKDLPLVGLTTFNGSCQTGFAQFKSPQNKKRDSWNFKLLIRCPCRPAFSIKLRLFNSRYDFETEPIRISQKDKRTVVPKRTKVDADVEEEQKNFNQTSLDISTFADILHQRVTVNSPLPLYQCVENFFSYKRLTNALLDQKDVENFRAYFGDAPYDADNMLEMYSQKSFVGHMNSTEAKKIFMSATSDSLFIIRYSSSNFERGYFVFENAYSAYRIKRINNQFQTEGGKIVGSLQDFLTAAHNKGELIEPLPHCNWMILTQSKYKHEIPI